MSVIRKTMLMQEIDNVAVATENIACGEATVVAGETITANQDIPRGHKIARSDIKAGDTVRKYGRTIGIASADIRRGDWVHTHNVSDITEDLEVIKQQEVEERLRASGDAEIKPFRTAPKLSRYTFKGFRRSNGDVGIRNNVVVISVIQCANTAAQKIAQACDVGDKAQVDALMDTSNAWNSRTDSMTSSRACPSPACIRTPTARLSSASAASRSTLTGSPSPSRRRAERYTRSACRQTAASISPLPKASGSSTR